MDTKDIILALKRDDLSDSLIISLSRSASKKIIEKDEDMLQFLFKTEDGAKFLNEYVNYIYNYKEDLFGSEVPDKLLEAISTNIGQNDNTPCFNANELGVYATKISALFVTQAAKHGDIEKTIDVIKRTTFKENDLLSIVSGVFSSHKKNKESTIALIKEKIKDIGEEPDNFMLFAYLAICLKKDRKKKNVSEVFGLINENLRLSDLEDIINSSPKKITFGLGYKTKEITELLINKTTFNKIEDMKNALTSDLVEKEIISRKVNKL